MAEEEDEEGVLLGGQFEPVPRPFGAVGRQVHADVGVVFPGVLSIGELQKRGRGEVTRGS